MSSINFLITGVGGQGSLLMSNVLSEVGVRLGHDVKKNEVHGMSQRGGSVTSHVRWGDQVRSPVIGEGEVDVLLALEKLEGLRYLNMLRPNARVLMGDFRIDPLSVSAGADQYPDDGEVVHVLSQVTKDYHFAPTIEIADKLGNSRVHNIVLLGALSAQMQEIPQEVWLEVIAERVPPKHVELNRAAFLAGAAFFQQKEVAQD
jgi:indolepyruvate ferredoxin oxidoreductase, beta subunit